MRVIRRDGKIVAYLRGNDTDCADYIKNAVKGGKLSLGVPSNCVYKVFYSNHWRCVRVINSNWGTVARFYLEKIY